MIPAALQYPEFAARWADPSDPGFRPFAAAALRLHDTRDGLSGQNREFYHTLTVVNRAQLLTQVAGMPVGPGMIRLLERTQWRGFGREHWLALFSIAAEAKRRRTLGHLRRITPCLVRQFEYVPAELWLPRVMGILNGIRIAPERWQRLTGALERAVESERAALRAMARKIDGRGALWDFIFLCTEGRARPLLVPAGAFGSTVLAPLTTGDECATEGLRMHNCLEQLVERAAAGNRILFRGLGDSPVTAGLVLTTAGWIPDGALGWDNKVLDPKIGRAVEQELEMLADRLNANRPDPAVERIDRYVAECAARAHAQFPAVQIDAMSQALSDIRGRSLTAGNGAFVIFTSRNRGYVQFMSDLGGREHSCEIGSHQFTPSVSKFLTEPAVEFIERAGFLWPRQIGNFLRWFPSGTTDACRTMAALTLECFARVFRLRPGQPITIDINIPSDVPSEAAS